MLSNKLDKKSGMKGSRITAEHQLHLLDRDMRRLAGEMSRLQRETGMYGTPTLADFDPKPFSGDFFTAAGGGVHAESWRKKENFHLDNPVVKDRDGRHQFRLEFDLRQFKPEEIAVSTEGHQLTVQARHEENDEGKKARREYFRQYTIPNDVDPMTLVSRQSHTGILSVYAPLPVGSEAQSITITRK
nr:hypothetical protein BaRGS_033852 [Batillaria attramentaria]